jgi:hypothetical protein
MTPASYEQVGIIPGNAGANPYTSNSASSSGLLRNLQLPGTIVWLGQFNNQGQWVDFGEGATQSLINSLSGYAQGAKVVSNGNGVRNGIFIGQLFVQAPAPAQPSSVAAPIATASTASASPVPAPALIAASAPPSNPGTAAVASQVAPAQTIVQTVGPTPEPDGSVADDTDLTEVAPAGNSDLLWLLLAAAALVLIS